MFSKINLTDDTDLASNDETFIKNLGSIKVTALRGKETGPVYKSNKFEIALDNRVSFFEICFYRSSVPDASSILLGCR